MKTYFSELIPKFQNFSKKLDDVSILTNQHWTIFNQDSKQRVVYIFRSNNELLISKDGNVEKGEWEYLGNNSLLIDQQNDSFLFNHGFLNDKVLALKIDGKSEYAILLNENKIGNNISSFDDVIELLQNDYNHKYLKSEKGRQPEHVEKKEKNEPILSESNQKTVDTSLGKESKNLALVILALMGLGLLLAIMLS